MDDLAMTLLAPGRPLAAVRRPAPAPGRGEVLLEVSACGVCRTDLHIVDGELPDARLPLVPGHEVVGRVVALGPGAGRFRPGERVGVPWLGGACGHCGHCGHGRENLCDDAQFTGYSRDDLYADPQLLLRIAHPDDRSHFAKMLVEGDITQRRIWRWIRRDGSILWTEGRRTHIYDASGNLVAIESIARDITETKRAEERAAAAEELQRVLLAAIPDTVIKVARSGSITKILNTSATPSAFVRDRGREKAIRDALGIDEGSMVIGAVGRLEDMARRIAVTAVELRD